ncbi:MAG: hypothetical protein QXS90_01405, partial [Candidatus Diapherotrites archaeon]
MKEESKIQTSYEVSFKIDDYDFIFSDFDARHYSQRSISDDFLITAKKAITGKEHENIEVKFLIKKDKRSTAIEEIIKKRLHDHFKKHEKTLEKELNENIKREKKIKRLEKLANDFAIIEQALEQYQTLRRDSIIEALNSAIASFWQILYPYKDYVSAFISIDEDGDYRFYVSNGKEHKLLDTVASGGERAVYALALRMS